MGSLAIFIEKVKLKIPLGTHMGSLAIFIEKRTPLIRNGRIAKNIYSIHGNSKNYRHYYTKYCKCQL
jgi:hypothetical protein